MLSAFMSKHLSRFNDLGFLHATVEPLMEISEYYDQFQVMKIEEEESVFLMWFVSLRYIMYMYIVQKRNGRGDRGVWRTTRNSPNISKDSVNNYLR